MTYRVTVPHRDQPSQRIAAPRQAGKVGIPLEPRFNGICQSAEVHMVPDPDAVPLLGLGELLLCSAGDGPSSCFSPLSGAAQSSRGAVELGMDFISINRSHQWALGSEKDLRCL